MNILMVHPHDLFSKSEPWAIRIKSLALEFVKRSHRVKICYFPEISNIKNCPKNIDSIELVPLDRAVLLEVFIQNTVKLIKLSKEVDIIHFQKCHPHASVPAVLAAYINKKPLHYDWDDWEEKIWRESTKRTIHSEIVGIFFKIFERQLPLLADTVSCSSDFLKSLTCNFGVRKDRLFSSPVGADLGKFKPGLDGSWVKERYNLNGNLVLYVGQLHGAQYVDLFIRAAAMVLERQPNVRFMIVGEGFLENKLKQLACDLKIIDKIIFTGSIPHDEVPYYIAASQVCVAAFKDTKVTRCKSPLKIAEYMTCGKAIVASAVGEVNNMLNGCGILTAPGDVKSLAAGIEKFSEDEILRREMGKKARERAVEKYNWAFTADNLLRAYELSLRNYK